MKTDQRQTALPDIDEIQPRSQNDEECLKEIREVLRKHSALQRFGVTLLHQHFPIAEDEVLLETCNVERRTLIIRPVKKSEMAPARMVETNWRLDTNSVTSGCMQICKYDEDNHHNGTDHLQE